MKRIVSSFVAGVVLTAGILLSLAAFAQDGPLALLRPLVVDIRQSVPLVADVVVPLDNGESVTTTVPLTVDIALQVAVSGVVSQSVSVVEETEPEVAIATATPMPPATVQQDVELVYDDVRWTVVSGKNVGQEYDDPSDNSSAIETGNMFIIVDFIVENMGSQPQRININPRSTYGVQLRDNRGRTFEYYHGFYDDCDNLDLNPGLSDTCPRVYEVPTDATGFSVIFVMPDGDEQSVDLGF